MAILGTGLFASGLLENANAAGSEDRVLTLAILAKVPDGGASPAASAYGRAQQALLRADNSRKSGDEPHARLAESLAKSWAEAGRDLEAATDLESKAAQASQGALDAGAQLEREQALLEESMSRVGRLRAQLDAGSKP
jgi:hypothetical protein